MALTPFAGRAPAFDAAGTLGHATDGSQRTGSVNLDVRLRAQEREPADEATSVAGPHQTGANARLVQPGATRAAVVAGQRSIRQAIPSGGSTSHRMAGRFIAR